MSGIGTLSRCSSSLVVHVLAYIITVPVLHVLSTPRYDTEQLEWSDDIMHFDTVMC